LSASAEWWGKSVVEAEGKELLVSSTVPTNGEKRTNRYATKLKRIFDNSIIPLKNEEKMNE
jgi:hypothetical protein